MYSAVAFYVWNGVYYTGICSLSWSQKVTEAGWSIMGNHSMYLYCWCLGMAVLFSFWRLLYHFKVFLFFPFQIWSPISLSLSQDLFKVIYCINYQFYYQVDFFYQSSSLFPSFSSTLPIIPLQPWLPGTFYPTTSCLPALAEALNCTEPSRGGTTLPTGF